MTAEHHSGFVGIVGAPNVGKSTLLNRLLGEKVAITSPKPQTTRHRILGVWTGDAAQVIFMDTPGVHKAENLLGRELVSQALAVLPDADLILYMIDVADPGREEDIIAEAVRESGKPVVLALNKIDRIRKDEMLPLMEQYDRDLQPAAIVPISARNGQNIEALMKVIIEGLPLGPEYYPPDALTDQPERFIAAEMIREQVFRLTGREIPYSSAVTVESYKEEPEIIKIEALIHVERESQKRIVIGAKGAKIKEIGMAARRDIERMTGVKVFLKLFVRVQKNWSKDPNAIREFGYTPRA